MGRLLFIVIAAQKGQGWRSVLKLEGIGVGVFIEDHAMSLLKFPKIPSTSNLWHPCAECVTFKRAVLIVVFSAPFLKKLLNKREVFLRDSGKS